MSEQTANQPVFYTKDFGTYSNSENNFVANQELTVTVTLNEYRELVKEVALADAKNQKANSEKYDAQRDVERLTKENTELKTKIYELQNATDTMDEVDL